MGDLGLLPAGEGEVVGAVVVERPTCGPDCEANAIWHAFLWDSTTGVVTELPVLDGTNSCSASDINDLGQIVGTCDQVYPVSWEANTNVAHRLDIGNATSAGASSVNNLGQIVGHVQWVGMTGHAALWTSFTAPFQDLGKLPTSSYDMTLANDNNDRGQVVGMANPELWVWDPATRAITQLPGGPSWSGAAINDRGQIVGTSGGQALLWNPL